MNRPTPSAVQDLWSRFEGDKSPEARRDLVLHYLSLVKYVVARSGFSFSARRHGLEIGDMFQSGVIGLMDAVDRYRPAMGVKFETYAAPRIKGAIQDALRAIDWLPRSVRGRSRLAEETIRTMAQEAGSDPIDIDVATRLGLCVDDYRRLMAGASLSVSPGTSVGGAGEESILENIPSNTGDPFEILSEAELRNVLAHAVEELPERDQVIVGLYYFEGLKFAEIAAVLEVTESRVSQIHSRILRELKKRLEQAASVDAPMPRNGRSVT